MSLHMQSGIRNQKQKAECEVDAAEDDVGSMQAVLKIERQQGDAVDELLENRRDHHEPEANRVPSDHDEGELPGEAGAHESVIKGRVGYRRRILLTDFVEDEVKRREDEYSPDGGEVEDDTGEFHPEDCKGKDSQNVFVQLTESA
jgi:hypothetical protein